MVYGFSEQESSSSSPTMEYRAHDLLDEREFFTDINEAKKWVEDRATRYAEAILKWTKP